MTTTLEKYTDYRCKAQDHAGKGTFFQTTTGDFIYCPGFYVSGSEAICSVLRLPTEYKKAYGVVESILFI